MIKSRFIGMVFEGKWEVCSIDYKKNNVVLINSLNKREMKIAINTLRKIEKGKTTISYIIEKKIPFKERYDYKKRSKNKV